MKHAITIFLVVVIVSACNTGKEQTHNENTATHETEQADIPTGYSSAMTQFIALLENDHYNIDTTLSPDTLKFKQWRGFEKIDEIQFLPEQVKGFAAKRTTRLEDEEGNWYPRFSVYEIVFTDTAAAMQNEEKINYILTGDDAFNDKNYDYLVRNNNRLIYVTCGAKIFESHALSYKPKLEQLIRH